MAMPTIEEKKFNPIIIVYILIVLICISGIGYIIYDQYYKDEKIGVILGITNEKTDEEIDALKEQFLNIFTNDITTIKEYSGNIKKLTDNGDIIIIGEEVKEQTENYTLNVNLPYFNINSSIATKNNVEISSIFKDKCDSVKKSVVTDLNIIYNVKFKAYIYDNILSLVVLSELKEGDNNQRTIIQTYNYDLTNNKKINIEDLIKLKEIDENTANYAIQEEIKASQEQNIKLQELGYNAKVRDYKDDMYKINKADEFFIGEKGYLYVIYAYGNAEHTNEMNVVIFK